MLKLIRQRQTQRGRQRHEGRHTEGRREKETDALCRSSYTIIVSMLLGNERQTDGETCKQISSWRETERQTGKQREIKMGRWKGSQSNTVTCEQGVYLYIQMSLNFLALIRQ